MLRLAYSLMLVALVGCNAIQTAPQPTANTAANVGASIARADAKLEKAEPVVSDMTPANLPVEKPKALALIGGAREDLKEGAAGAKLAEKQATKDAKTIEKQADRIEELEAKSLFRTGLESAALVFVVGGFLGIVGSFWWGGWKVRRLAIVAILAGIGMFVIARVVGPLMVMLVWAFGILAAVVVAICVEWLLTHRTLVAERIAAAVTPDTKLAKPKKAER